MSGGDPDAIASVRRIDGTSRNNKRPAGVTAACQIKQHSVERQADDVSNVLDSDMSGSERCNKPSHFRPEVAVIRCSGEPPRDAEGLARRRAGEDVGVIVVSGETAGVGPAAKASEQVLLSVSSKVIRLYCPDIAFIHVSGRNVTGVDEIAQPGSRERVVLVVVSRFHAAQPPRPCPGWSRRQSAKLTTWHASRSGGSGCSSVAQNWHHIAKLISPIIPPPPAATRAAAP
jgi:hypothetical protein